MKKMTLLGANSKLTSYLDGFPMPYYTIVSDVTTLPEIISQALREWFELVQK
jgi:midasin